MFNKAEILARLQDGDTVDQIADELAGAINAAQAEYKELQEQEKIQQEADKEAARVKEAKRQAVLGMIDCLCDYAVAAGGYEELLDELHDVDVDKVIEAIDSMLGMVKLLGALENLEFKNTAAPAKIKRDAVFNADDVLKDFLKSI